MSFRRAVGLGAVTLLVATAACTSLLGGFDVDPGSASSGNITTDDGGGEASTSFDASVDGAASEVDAACGPDLLFCGDRCVGPSSDHCGSCEACPSTAPICNIPPGDASPFCGSSCSPSAPTVCSGTCVDTTSNAAHCGRCDNACSAVRNATATCNGDAGCGFDCNSGFHACGDVCADDKATETCGSACKPCEPPANAVATCDGLKCGFKCNGALRACGNACFNLATSELHCGDCAKSCSNAAVCTGGACIGRYGFTTPLGSQSGNSITHILAMKIVVPRAVTVTHLAALVRGTGGSVVMGLYNDVGGAPKSLLAQTASTAVAATGNFEVPLTTATNIAAGSYWVGTHSSANGVFGYNASSAPGYAYTDVGNYTGTLAGTWPTTSAGVTSNGTLNYWMVVRE